LAETKEKQYIYIVQAVLEPSKCKIGKTNDYKRRLNEYNNMTGKSKDNIYKYLFVCEVKNMTKVENDLKEEFKRLREEDKKEMYFYNKELFDDYVNFIKSHKMYKKENLIKNEEKKEIVKIVKKMTPNMKERGIKSFKDLLQKSKKVKNDEFYTRYEDVELELSMYDKKIWGNKTVFCNCDDAVGGNENNSSAFALYFIRNFGELKLKKLICTHYVSNVDLFYEGPKGYIFTKYGYKEIEQKKEYPDNYDGSFDSPLSLKILKEEADIVCTNPPFSKAIEYWDILIKSGKKFIILSAQTNPVNTAFIKYFKDKKVWAGFYQALFFLSPKKEKIQMPAFWYTNIKINNRPKSKYLKFVKLKEIPEKYKKIDDNGMLLVDNCYIPIDYNKEIAVSNRPIINGILEKGYEITQYKRYEPYINGKACFARVLIKKI
jgi:hypothetical protein